MVRNDKYQRVHGIFKHVTFSCQVLATLLKLTQYMHSFILLKLKFRACNVQRRIQICSYSLNGMGARKNPSKNIFSIFKTLRKELNEEVRKYLGNSFFFKRHRYAFQRHQISNIFGISAPIMGGLQGLLTYPHTNFKKTVYPKSVWMALALHHFYQFIKRVVRIYLE